MFVAILLSSDAIGLRVPNGLGSFTLGWKRVQGKFSVGGFHLDYDVFESYRYMPQELFFIYRSYEEMENEVSQILGFRWYALNDKQYKLTPVNLNVPYYYEGFEEAE